MARGAAAAADRVASEHIAGSHISAKIGEIKGYFTSGKKELDDAKNFVLTKRNNFIAWGFEVDDRGIVSAVEKVRQLQQAGQGRPDVMAAGFALMAEAGRHTTELLQALQHAEGVAMRVETSISTASSELTDLVLREAPSEAARTFGLVPGAQPTPDVPPALTQTDVLAALQAGMPVSYTDPNGKTTTITPNPDGTQTLTQSATSADGVTTTTSSTNGGPATTTTTQLRPDGSGVIDTTVTGPDGKAQRLQTVPKDGRSTTYVVNDDGSLGAAVSESYPAPNGGLITDAYAPDGGFQREWQRPDGYREVENYIAGPDGQPVLVGTGTSAGVQSTLNTDGSIDTTYPNGQSAKTVTLEDGTVLTKFSDDSVLAYDPDTAPEGTPRASSWEVVQSWTTQQWDQFVGSTAGTATGHPVATGAGVAASGISEAALQAGTTMAGEAAQAAGRSAEASGRAFALLDSGTPGAGRLVVESMDNAATAANAASKAEILANTGKFGGAFATAGLAVYTNVDDVLTDGKGVYEAVGNATGGTVGGIGGAAAGAWAGGLAGGFTGPAAPVAVPVFSVLGAMAGGYGIGSFGSYVGDQAGAGVRELFE